MLWRKYLNYSIFKKNVTAVIKASGKISKGAVLSSGNFIRSLISGGSTNITLDIDGLEDEREMIYHVALINSFKKEVERAGGVFTLVATRPSVQTYLSISGLSRLFIYKEQPVIAQGENYVIQKY